MDTDTKIVRPSAPRLAQFDAARPDTVRYTSKVQPYVDPATNLSQAGRYEGRHRPESVPTKVIRPDAIAAAKVPDRQVAVPLPPRAHGEEMRRLQGSRSGKVGLSSWAKLRNSMGRRFRP